MTARVLVVVSGLAASGKSTVGRGLADRLALPLVDKDDILEALFDSLGCADRGQRYRLSRASDEVLYRLAASSDASILVNWWDHDTAPARLGAAATALVEVFCDCPVDLAAARFAERHRHPGHLDELRTREEHEEGLQRMRESFRGPLRVSDPLITVDTGGPVDLDELADRVRSAIASS